ncbi:MAG: hypothetical protein R2791_09655 [Saprospiraceae bacterium]
MFKNIVNKAKEKLDEQNANLKRIKEKANEKLAEMNEGLKEAKEKAAEKISDVNADLKDLKAKATEKLEETGDRLKEAKQKAGQGLAAKGEELRDLKDQAMGKITLEHMLPEVKTIIAKKVVPMLNLRTFGNVVGEERKASAFRTAYEFLPTPVRLIVSQESFVRFCMSNKSAILDAETEQKLLDAPAPQAHFSAADELLKLKQMMDSGVLTEDEFNHFKQQLM